MTKKEKIFIIHKKINLIKSRRGTSPRTLRQPANKQGAKTRSKCWMMRKTIGVTSRLEAFCYDTKKKVKNEEIFYIGICNGYIPTKFVIRYRMRFDEILSHDPMARVACEVVVNTGLVLVVGEITTNCYVDIDKIARATIKEIGYDRAKYGFDAETCAILVSIDEQSRDIALGVTLLRGQKRQ